LLRYYITDRSQFSGPEDERRQAVLECVERAAREGVDMIQLREKDLRARDLEWLAISARDRVHGTRTKLLVNGRVDVAIACGLDGVHLTSAPDELLASQARAIFGSARVLRPIIGVSCHSLEEVARAEAHGADYVMFGPAFEKGGVAVNGGVQLLRAACERANAARPPIRVIAVGGINESNAAAVIDAGAAGVAAIRMFQKQKRRA
jgi:thiamine-phosphate pyrophosphorylase